MIPLSLLFENKGHLNIIPSTQGQERDCLIIWLQWTWGRHKLEATGTRMNTLSTSIHLANTAKSPRSSLRFHSGYLLRGGLGTIITKQNKVAYPSHRLLDLTEGFGGWHCLMHQSLAQAFWRTNGKSLRQVPRASQIKGLCRIMANSRSSQGRSRKSRSGHLSFLVQEGKCQKNGGCKRRSQGKPGWSHWKQWAKAEPGPDLESQH